MMESALAAFDNDKGSRREILQYAQVICSNQGGDSIAFLHRPMFSQKVC